jgi:hypothetical protein
VEVAHVPRRAALKCRGHLVAHRGSREQQNEELLNISNKMDDTSALSRPDVVCVRHRYRGGFGQPHHRRRIPRSTLHVTAAELTGFRVGG